jgi:hypothetical protein
MAEDARIFTDELTENAVEIFEIKSYGDYLKFHNRLKQSNELAWSEEEFNRMIKDKIGLPCAGTITVDGAWGYVKLNKFSDCPENLTDIQKAVAEVYDIAIADLQKKKEAYLKK